MTTSAPKRSSRPAGPPAAAEPALALYQQIKDHIVRRIQDGSWRAGDRLPSESEPGAAVRHVAHDREPRAARTGRAGPHRARGRRGQLRCGGQAAVHAAADRQPRQRDPPARPRLPLRRAGGGARLRAAGYRRGAGPAHRRVGLPCGLRAPRGRRAGAPGRPLREPRAVPQFGAQDFTRLQPSEYLVRNVPFDQMEHVVDAVLPTPEQARLLEMAGAIRACCSPAGPGRGACRSPWCAACTRARATGSAAASGPTAIRSSADSYGGHPVYTS